jgi:hypothetical protein
LDERQNGDNKSLPLYPLLLALSRAFFDLPGRENPHTLAVNHNYDFSKFMTIVADASVPFAHKLLRHDCIAPSGDTSDRGLTTDTLDLCGVTKKSTDSQVTGFYQFLLDIG